MQPTISYKNGVLSIDHTPLLTAVIEETYLTADLASGAGTMTVRAITGFAVNQVLLIGELGSENAEIVKTHASTAPSGSTITLAANTTRAHPSGTKVYILPYDRFELTQDDNEAGASKTALTTTLGSGMVAIQPDERVQEFRVTDSVEGYFFARYYNSISSSGGSYSDGLISSDWAQTTMGYMIGRALRDAKAELGDELRKEDFYAWANKILKTIEGKQIRWPDFFVYNYQTDTIEAGVLTYSLPTDIYETRTNRSFIAVRLGNSGTPLRYLDPIDFEKQLGDLVRTTAAEVGSVGETALDVASDASLPESGTITYFVSGARYSFTYTSKSGNTLSGIPASGDGSITVEIPSGTAVYAYASPKTQPKYYTVRNGLLEIEMPDENIHGVGIEMDYVTVATSVNSDGDTIDMHRYDMVQSYLTWRAWCKAHNGGVLDKNSGFYSDFREDLNDAIRTSPRTVKSPFRPRVNTMRQR